MGCLSAGNRTTTNNNAYNCPPTCSQASMYWTVFACFISACTQIWLPFLGPKPTSSDVGHAQPSHSISSQVVSYWWHFFPVHHSSLYSICPINWWCWKNNATLLLGLAPLWIIPWWFPWPSEVLFSLAILVFHHSIIPSPPNSAYIAWVHNDLLKVFKFASDVVYIYILISILIMCSRGRTIF